MLLKHVSISRLLFVVCSLHLLTAERTFADWEVTPEAALSVRHDDNIFVRVSPAIAETRSVVEGSLRLLNRGQRGEFTIEPRVTFDSYRSSEYENLESTDKFLTMTAARSWRRTEGDFSIDYADESVLRSEFAPAIVDDATDLGLDITDPDVGTGLLDAVLSQRERIVAYGNLESRMSQRSRFAVRASFLDADYGSAQNAQNAQNAQIDRAYQNSDLALDFIRVTDERTRVSGRLLYSDFRSNRTDNDSQSLGIEAIFRRELSPLWTFNLNAGAGQSDYEFVDQNQVRTTGTETNLLFGARLRRTAQRTSLTLAVRHSVDPNGSGFLVVRDEFRVFASRALTSRLNAEFGARFFTLESVGNVDPTRDRDFARLQLAFDWSIRPTLFLEFGADTLTQEFAGPRSRSPTSNLYYVGIRYRARSRADR